MTNDYGTGCRCDWLGVGTPEHAPSALCISLRPNADRDEVNHSPGAANHLPGIECAVPGHCDRDEEGICGPTPGGGWTCQPWRCDNPADCPLGDGDDPFLIDRDGDRWDHVGGGLYSYRGSAHRPLKWVEQQFGPLQ